MNTFIFMVLLFWMYVEHLSMHIPLLEQRVWDYYLHRGRLKGRLICYPEQVISEPSPLWSLVLTFVHYWVSAEGERNGGERQKSISDVYLLHQLMMNTMFGIQPVIGGRKAQFSSISELVSLFSTMIF